MIYGVGYQDREPSELVDVLVRTRVSLLVGVRLTPKSRQRGCSRRALGESIEAAGISSRHEPALGNPVDNRAA